MTQHIRHEKRHQAPPVSPLMGRMPPQATELEAYALGAMMVEPNRLQDVFAIIRSADAFFTDAHQLVFSAIQDLYSKGRPIDFMTVIAELRAKGDIDRVGGPYYVTQLTQNVISAAHIEEWCRIILQKYMQRELIRVAGNALAEAYEDGADVFELMDQAHEQLDRLRMDNVAVPYRHIGDGAEKDLEAIEDRMRRSEAMDSTLSGVDTGFRVVNALTNGWRKNELIILAARPSVGKTAFGLNLAVNAATSQHKPTPVGFFSLEMDIEQLRLRVRARMSGVGLTNLSSGKISADEFQRVSTSQHKIKGLQVFIDDSFSLTTMDLKAKARKMKQKHGVGLIIIDYLQLMKPASDKVIREQQIAQISRDLKGIARELEIPVIALSQLNREVEKRSNPEPVMGDIRESGAIEQDADVIAFLYRQDEEIWGKFAKNRNGKIDKFPLAANMDLQLFTDPEDNSPQMAYKGFSPTANAAAGGRMTLIHEATGRFLDEENPKF